MTGTNGKTTTTGMLAAMLARRRARRRRVRQHRPAVPGRGARGATTCSSSRCSSFQLAHQTSFHPVVSVLLNLAPDHLDWHGSFEAYETAKARIFARQPGTTTSTSATATIAAAAAISGDAQRARSVWFRRDAPGPDEVGYEDGELVARTRAPRRPRVRRRVARVTGPTPPPPRRRRWRSAPSRRPSAPGSAGYRRGTPPWRGGRTRSAGSVSSTTRRRRTCMRRWPRSAGVTDAVLIAGGRAKGSDLVAARRRCGPSARRRGDR